MIRAHVVEQRSDEKTAVRGEFEFIQLPAPGDRIVIGNVRGGIDIMQVLYVEHHPVAIPPSKSARKDASATIYVGFIADEY